MKAWIINFSSFLSLENKFNVSMTGNRNVNKKKKKRVLRNRDP